MNPNKNIFIISTWYPSEENPISGSFIKEQSMGIAKHFPEYRILVSLRSDVDVKLSASNPIKIIYQFIKGTFTATEEENLLDNYIEIESPAFSLKDFSNVRNAFTRFYALTENNLKYAIRKYGEVNLLHAHVWGLGGHIAALLSKKYNIPYVITEHTSGFEYDALNKKGDLKPEFLFTFKNAYKAIAVSNSFADRFESLGLKRPVVIPNMIDENKFKVSSNEEEKFVFLTVGGLNQKKGIDDLLEAINIWSPESKNIKFRIVGGGPSADFYQNKSKELGIENYIEWMGVVPREEMPEVFNNCSVFALPSHTETFGIVYIEALASGKPVIATKCGGPEDIVNNSNGLLIEKENPFELAEALEWMYDNHHKFQPSDIRKDFEERFSQKAVTQKIASVYEEAIQNCQ